jgi:hypothetical protein
MSGRKRARANAGRKVVTRRLGQPSDSETDSGNENENSRPGRRQDTTSSSSPSTRALPDTHVAALTTYCARAFVLHFRELVVRETTWPDTRTWLDRLPDTLVPGLFAMLADSYTALTHGLIVQVGQNRCITELAS